MQGAGVVQHWKGNWQPFEGTRAWAKEVGFRALATESEDILNGPPPRKDLRRAYYERDARMAGTGPLVSWTDGRAFKDEGVEEIAHRVHLLFLAFCDQEKADSEIEKELCDLFMGLRLGEPSRVHAFFQLLHNTENPAWFAAVRRALQFEVMQGCFPQVPKNGSTFWATGLLREYTALIKSLAIDTSGLRWGGFVQDTPLRFGQLLLWSKGACGQTIRSQILNDWTHLVLEQGLLTTTARVDWLHPNQRSCARWLVDAFIWRACLSLRQTKPTWSVHTCWGVARRSAAEARSPEQGDIGWQVEPRHWNWIIEWVIAWRAELHSDQMLGRAEALAHHLLEADSAAYNPFKNPVLEATIPENPLDLDNRITYTFRTRYPDDWRLSDEIYPAIFTAVAGCLRGAGKANSSGSVLTAAPWLRQLLPHRRPRMVNALRGLLTGYKQLAAQSDDAFLSGWEKATADGLRLTQTQFDEWSACQATPPEELLEAAAYTLLEGDSLPAQLLEQLPTRLKEQTHPTGPGTGLGRGIELDLLWGIEALMLCIKPLPMIIGERGRSDTDRTAG